MVAAVHFGKAPYIATTTSKQDLTQVPRWQVKTVQTRAAIVVSPGTPSPVQSDCKRLRLIANGQVKEDQHSTVLLWHSCASPADHAEHEHASSHCRLPSSSRKTLSLAGMKAVVINHLCCHASQAIRMPLAIKNTMNDLKSYLAAMPWHSMPCVECVAHHWLSASTCQVAPLAQSH